MVDVEYWDNLSSWHLTDLFKFDAFSCSFTFRTHFVPCLGFKLCALRETQKTDPITISLPIPFGGECNIAVPLLLSDHKPAS